MTYEKHTWQNGEVITAEKLNNIENGISSCGDVLVIEVDQGGTSWSLGVSYNQIVSMITNSNTPTLIAKGGSFSDPSIINYYILTCSFVGFYEDMDTLDTYYAAMFTWENVVLGSKTYVTFKANTSSDIMITEDIPLFPY